MKQRRRDKRGGGDDRSERRSDKHQRYCRRRLPGRKSVQPNPQEHSREPSEGPHAARWHSQRQRKGHHAEKGAPWIAEQENEHRD